MVLVNRIVGIMVSPFFDHSGGIMLINHEFEDLSSSLPVEREVLHSPNPFTMMSRKRKSGTRSSRLELGRQLRGGCGLF